MRSAPSALLANMKTPFLGDNKPLSFITVQYTPTWWLTETEGTAVGVPPLPTMLPFRYFVDQAQSQHEIVVPNLKQVVFDDQIASDAPTLAVEIWNIDTSVYADPPTPDVLGDPGAMSFMYGNSPLAGALWNHFVNGWTDVLRENALLRWYFGYGPQDLSFADAKSGGYVIDKGLWLVDDPSIEAQTGIITLTCRAAGGKLTLDQDLYPLLVNPEFYTASGINFVPPMFTTYLSQPGFGAPGELTPIVTGKSKEGFPKTIVDAMVDPNGNGYALVSAGGYLFAYNGTVGFGYGGIADVGDAGINFLPFPIAAAAVTPSGQGYWMVDAGGYVYPFADASPFGFQLSPQLGYLLGTGIPEAVLGNGATVVDAKSSFDGKGLWLLDNKGNLYTVGTAQTFGWTAPSATFISFSPRPQADGFVALDTAGVVHTAGAASNYGNYSGSHTPACIEMDGAGTGYRIVDNVNPNGETTSEIYNFGSAQYMTEKTGAWPTTLVAPIKAIRRKPDDSGYWLFGMDGGVFTFGPGANFYGSLPVEYTLWTPSNYVSPFNTDVYIDVIQSTIAANAPAEWPPNTPYPPYPVNSQVYDPTTGLLVVTGPDAAVLLAPDYMQIVRWIWLISGGFYPPEISYSEGNWTVTTAPAANEPPPFLGAIFDSGAYDALGPLDASTFDQLAGKQAINSLCAAIGYITRWRDDGGLYAGLPNIFAPGNFLEDADYAHTSFIPIIQQPAINDYVLTSTDAPLRSQILVSPQDPYLFDNSPPFPNAAGSLPGVSSTVTRWYPPIATLNILHGIQKTAMLGVPLNVPVSQTDQEIMAEFQAVQCYLATKSGSVQGIFDPRITTDCQVQVYERVTGDTNIAYVTGVHFEHDLDTGNALATYTTQILGQSDSWNISIAGGTINNQTFDEDGNLILDQTISLSSNMVARLAKGKSPPALLSFS